MGRSDLAGRLSVLHAGSTSVALWAAGAIGAGGFLGRTRGQVHPPQEASHNTARLALLVAHQTEAEVGGTYFIRLVDSSTFRSEG